MELSKQVQSQLESTIQKAINLYACGCEDSVVTDIHLQPVQSTGKLFIYDDDDKLLASETIEEWLDYDGDNFYAHIEHELRSVLLQMQEAGKFDKLTILKPYSFTLIDESKETMAELLLMDDDTLIIESDLLKGLDKELDDFLTQLLKN